MLAKNITIYRMPIDVAHGSKFNNYLRLNCSLTSLNIHVSMHDNEDKLAQTKIIVYYR